MILQDIVYLFLFLLVVRSGLNMYIRRIYFICWRLKGVCKRLCVKKEVYYILCDIVILCCISVKDLFLLVGKQWYLRFLLIFFGYLDFFQLYYFIKTKVLVNQCFCVCCVFFYLEVCIVFFLEIIFWIIFCYQYCFFFLIYFLLKIF